jgi:hypothetical protein
MKERKFWMPLHSPVEYRMKHGKTVNCKRKVYIFGICIAIWDVFVPD